MDAAIEVTGLRKRYGDFEAVRGVDFAVRRGEVFGLLGPNGAGKTTTVEILEGYRNRSAGRVSVLGYDPASRDPDLRARMGIVLQSSGIYQYLTVHESVAHWAGFYPRPRDVEEVISIEEGQIDVLPSAAAACIEGIVRVGDRLVVLLRPDGIFGGVEGGE